jgi:chromosome segregation ATPase
VTAAELEADRADLLERLGATQDELQVVAEELAQARQREALLRERLRRAAALIAEVRREVEGMLQGVTE